MRPAPAPMKRLADWRPRLRRFLDWSAVRPIEPGWHDCCLFGAGALEAQTGRDLAAPWRGQYSSFAEGYRLLRRAGYTGPVEFISHHLREEHLSAARCGDIAVVPTDDGDAVGVVQGETVYALSQWGLALLPMDARFRFFRVGDA
ncbi:MAG: hypothetical protein HLUCCO07_11985 [Rhodobacteraceae bacterium HLUCCO07]|nr:MAG: hypothetical protein HLUCCO07_11985 [Rhodobacteraceae bacterium HLUCCO07]